MKAQPLSVSFSIVVLACLVFVFPGCSSSRGASGGSEIGYGNFVRLNGIVYSGAGNIDSTAVDRSTVFGRTRVKLQDGPVTRPGGSRKDGDAGQLAPGTTLYPLKGRDPGLRLAARFDGRWTLYKAERNDS